MDLLVETEGKVYRAIAIDGPRGFASPFPDALFPCLIWDHDGHFTEAQRSAVARALLKGGCRYAVCGGQSCEAWHDSVDTAFVEQHLDDPEQLAGIAAAADLAALGDFGVAHMQQRGAERTADSLARRRSSRSTTGRSCSGPAGSSASGTG